MFLTGADVERGGERRAQNDVGVHGPEGQEVELLGRAVEVLFVKVGDLVDQVEVVGIGGLGGHFVSLEKLPATGCQLPACLV